MTDKYEITFSHEEAECVIMSEASLAILIQLRDWVQREIDSKTPMLDDVLLAGWLDDFSKIEPLPSENND